MRSAIWSDDPSEDPSLSGISIIIGNTLEPIFLLIWFLISLANTWVIIIIEISSSKILSKAATASSAELATSALLTHQV